jgi:hypothetical protein
MVSLLTWCCRLGSGDNQAVLDAVLAACEVDASCVARFPALRRNWQALLNSLPRKVSVTHPFTGHVKPSS